jgi:MraZ protein
VFVGRQTRQLDDKGRLALPAPYRPRFEPRCYLAYGEDGCIDVFTPEEFDRMAAETMERVRKGEIGRDVLRAIASNAFEVEPDRQGRINLDRELRDFADLAPGQVTVAGAFDRVEIWNADRYERQRSTGGAALKGA